ncbi:MAG: PA14 domain-containing protein [Pseudomonadota bacterium]
MSDREKEGFSKGVVSPGNETRNHATDAAESESNGFKDALKARFPAVDEVEVLGPTKLDPVRYVLVRVREKSIDRRVFCRELVQWGIARELSFVPVIYTPNEWKVLEEGCERALWLGGFEGADSSTTLLALYQRKPGYPRNFRRLLQRETKSHLHFVDFVQRSAQFPPHLSLAFCSTIMEEALTLLFASKGKVFTRDLDGIRFFEENFVVGDKFNTEDILLYFWLLGLAKQARHYAQLTGHDSEDLFGWNKAVTQLAAFLKRIDKYAMRHFTTEREHKKVHRRILAGVVSVVGLVAIAFVWRLIAMAPVRPIDNLFEAKKRSGGIAVEYFAGRAFNKKVLRRTDKAIKFSTYGSVAPEIPRDDFSARWQGYIFFPSAGAQTLCVQCDDGARLYFNNELLFEDWQDRPKRNVCANVHIKRGWYPIKVEYYEGKGAAVMQLLRGDDKEHARLVPPEHLCCKEDVLPQKTLAPKEPTSQPVLIQKPIVPASQPVVAPMQPMVPAKKIPTPRQLRKLPH